MTTQSVQIVTYDFGSSLSNVTLRNELTDALVATADSCLEVSTDAGVYLAVFTEASVIVSGIYRLRAVVSGSPINRFVRLTGTDGEVAVSSDDRSSVVTASGDATLAKQEEILEAISNISVTQLAAITVESGVISNFPETLTIGDSYTENTGRIKIGITNSDNEPITGLGSLDFADAEISFAAFRPGDSAVISGTCEFVDDVTETYVWLTLPASQTILGKAEYTYEGRLKFFWEGPSTGNSDDEQKTYKTTPFKFISNP